MCVGQRLQIVYESPKREEDRRREEKGSSFNLNNLSSKLEEILRRRVE